jgi:hypothetical protein
MPAWLDGASRQLCLCVAISRRINKFSLQGEKIADAP